MVHAHMSAGMGKVDITARDEHAEIVEISMRASIRKNNVK